MERDSLKKYLKGRKLLCLSLKPPKHFYETWGPNYDAENCASSSKELEVHEQSDEKFDEGSQSENMDLIMSNYIIMKEIFRNFHTWQELKLLSMVCKVWASAAKNITKNCLEAREFCLFTRTIVRFTFEMRSQMRVEPSLILTFANAKSLRSTYACHLYPHSPCDSNCKEKHKMMDYIYAKLCYPSKVLVGVFCLRLIYVPAGTENPTHRKMLNEIMINKDFPFISGVCLPHIPGVHVHEMSSSKTESECSFIPKLTNIMKTEIIKCIIIFAGTHFTELETYLRGIILTIKESQDEETPLAVAGCGVKCSFNDDFNICSSRDGKEMTLLIFSVDKHSETPAEFDAYSAVFKQGMDVELKMNQFAKVPRREFSAAIKLSCIGRTDLYEFEQEVFCKHFPTTSIVGCNGPQEIGTDSYPHYNAEELEPAEKRARIRFDSESDADSYDLFHSYSTVMVILMWGKLLPDQKKKSEGKP